MTTIEDSRLLGKQEELALNDDITTTVLARVSHLPMLLSRISLKPSPVKGKRIYGNSGCRATPYHFCTLLKLSQVTYTSEHGIST